MTRICFASNNQHKIEEVRQIVPPTLHVVGLADAGITEDIAETGSTFQENSAIKATYVFGKTGLSAFADDSGLVVHALHGQPGVYSARYAGPEKSDEKNIDLLLRNLGDTEDRRAHFKTVITLIDAEGTQTQFEGKVDGHILREKKGTNGFGYDPVFVPNGYQQTFAELDPQIKNSISHRGQAMKKLLVFLEENYG